MLSFPCSRWKRIPALVRSRLALAGFSIQNSLLTCLDCGVTVGLDEIKSYHMYEVHHFRSIHREQAYRIGKHCAFLLCETERENFDVQKFPDNNEYPEFTKYQKRLASFHNWPLNQESKIREKTWFITPENMALHGFFYSGPEDGVTCFCCGNTLMNWLTLENLDNNCIVNLEHARYFPCHFIHHIAGSKFVANARALHKVSETGNSELLFSFLE